MTDEPLRCAWSESSPEMREYHDQEWGRPSRDDAYLFELLVLEGAQAGLSWSTVLAKRSNYRDALDGFDYRKIARYTEARLAKLLQNPGIVRNRLKVKSLVLNAHAFMDVQSECGSFSNYLWGWVDDEPIVTRHRALQSVPARTELSDAISKDLKKRGFSFVGTTIIYAYLQAVGVVDDHQADCFAAMPPARRKARKTT
jgi:DNA-3-methyladenine glycosylase I